MSEVGLFERKSKFIQHALFLVNDQIDAQLFFLICLFQSSTCFEQTRARHQEDHLYQYNIWCMSLCIGGRLVCRSGRPPTQSDIYQTLYWYKWFFWWWERGCWKHVEDWNKHIRKNNCASSWSFTRIIPRYTVNRTWNALFPPTSMEIQNLVCFSLPLFTRIFIFTSVPLVS
jgi:hypothetical protein